MSLSLQSRFVSGWTRVREFDSAPPVLDLNGDLGVDLMNGLHAELVNDEGSIRWMFELDLFKMSGQGVLDRNFDYDEGRFKGGVPFEVVGEFVFGRVTATLKEALGNDPCHWIAPVVGLEYPRMHVGIAAEDGEHSTEDYTQFMPYPVLGLAWHSEVSPTLTFEARMTGTFIPEIPTFYKEGGTLHMSIAAVQATLA